MVDSTLHGSGVYSILSKACGRLYVGSTVNFRNRWKQHKTDLRRKVHRSSKLQDAWLLYGEDNFSFTILEVVPDRSMIYLREQFWLDFLDAADRGFNTLHLVDPTAKWAEGRRAAMSAKRMGHTVSEETREKLRQANLGKKTHTAESKAKLSAWNAGKKMSPDAIARTAAAWTGRKHSVASRVKMSETRKKMFADGTLKSPLKGRKLPPETIAKLTGLRRSKETRAKVSQARRAYFARLSAQGILF